MSFGKIDLNDGVISPFFVIATGVSTGLFEFSPFGLDFAAPLITLGTSLEVSFASIVAILAIGTAFATNRPDLSKLGLVETWVAAVTMILVLGQPVMPILDTIFMQTPIAGLVALVLQASGFYVLSYLG